MTDNRRDYEIGYGKPPKAHQFPKGKSGNPAGKKKKPILSAARIIEELWLTPYAIMQDGKPRKVIPFEKILEQLTANIAAGLPRASRVFHKYAEFTKGESAATIEQERIDKVLFDLEMFRIDIQSFRAASGKKRKPQDEASEPSPSMDDAPALPAQPRRRKKAKRGAREIFTGLNRSLIRLSDGKKMSRIVAVLKGLLVKAMKGDIDSADTLIKLRNASIKNGFY